MKNVSPNKYYDQKFHDGSKGLAWWNEYGEIDRKLTGADPNEFLQHFGIRELIIDSEIISDTGAGLATDTAYFTELCPGNDDVFYRARVTGEWSLDPSDNDQSIDFQANPLYVQLWVNDGGGWVYNQSAEVEYDDGERKLIDSEFQFHSDTDDIDLAVVLSTDDDHILGNNIVTAIDNHEKFRLRLQIWRKPRTQWFARESLPNVDDRTPLDGISLPYSGDLPFVGYYLVSVYYQIREYDGGGDVATRLPQSMKILTSPTQEICMSGFLDNETVVWINKSLQGTGILYGGGFLELTLPNGTDAQLSAGTATYKYLGKEMGMWL